MPYLFWVAERDAIAAFASAADAVDRQFDGRLEADSLTHAATALARASPRRDLGDGAGVIGGGGLCLLKLIWNPFRFGVSKVSRL